MCASPQGPRKEKLSCKGLQTNMASATQSKKRSKSGRFIKGELNRRKLCAEKLQVVGQQCSQGEKEPANTLSEESECEVSWDDGQS